METSKKGLTKKFENDDLRGGLSFKKEQIKELEHFRDAHTKSFGSLSKREKEVLTLLAEGYSNKEAADHLNLSRFTVENHRKSIKKKLDVDSFVDLYKYACAFELIQF